jgi:cation/acetate symporter
MAVQTLTYIFVGLTFGLYIAIALWSRARSTTDFYVAGGGVNPVVNGMATAADWMSAASFISMAGIIAFMGRDGAVYLLGWTGGYVLLALLLAPYLRKFGQFTVPDFIGERYYSRAARVVAVVCLIFISFTYIAGQMRGVGIVFSRFLEVDIATGVVIGMGIVFIYAVLGGMKGITYTQAAQYCVLIFAYMVPAIFISLLVSGSPIPQLGFGGTMADGSGRAVLETLDGILLDLGFGAYTDGAKSNIDVFAITAALMIGTAGLPHVIVRFFTVPKVSDARRSAGWALMAWQDKNDDGRLQYRAGAPFSGAPSFGETRGESGERLITNATTETANEVYVDRDIIVLANPEIAALPNWVIALVAAGGLAAALSTAAGLLLVISAAVSHDLLKKTFSPNLSERQELLYARVAIAVALGLAGLFGIYPPAFVAQVVAFAFGLAAASLFPAILLGVFSKRMNKEGAIAGMVVGLVFTFSYIVYFKFVSPGSNTAAHWLFGISPEGIGFIGAALNFAVAGVVARLTAPPPGAVQDLVDDIRLPSGAGVAHDHG